jgi:hypothetical protein
LSRLAISYSGIGYRNAKIHWHFHKLGYKDFTSRAAIWIDGLPVPGYVGTNGDLIQGDGYFAVHVNVAYKQTTLSAGADPQVALAMLRRVQSTIDSFIPAENQFLREQCSSYIQTRRKPLSIAVVDQPILVEQNNMPRHDLLQTFKSYGFAAKPEDVTAAILATAVPTRQNIAYLAVIEGKLSLSNHKEFITKQFRDQKGTMNRRGGSKTNGNWIIGWNDYTSGSPRKKTAALQKTGHLTKDQARLVAAPLIAKINEDNKAVWEYASQHHVNEILESVRRVQGVVVDSFGNPVSSAVAEDTLNDVLNILEGRKK